MLKKLFVSNIFIALHIGLAASAVELDPNKTLTNGLNKEETLTALGFHAPSTEIVNAQIVNDEGWVSSGVQITDPDAYVELVRFSGGQLETSLCKPGPEIDFEPTSSFEFQSGTSYSTSEETSKSFSSTVEVTAEQTIKVGTEGSGAETSISSTMGATKSFEHTKGKTKSSDKATTETFAVSSSQSDDIGCDGDNKYGPYILKNGFTVTKGEFVNSKGGKDIPYEYFIMPSSRAQTEFNVCRKKRADAVVLEFLDNDDQVLSAKTLPYGKVSKDNKFLKCGDERKSDAKMWYKDWIDEKKIRKLWDANWSKTRIKHLLIGGDEVLPMNNEWHSIILSDGTNADTKQPKESSSKTVSANNYPIWKSTIEVFLRVGTLRSKPNKQYKKKNLGDYVELDTTDQREKYATKYTGVMSGSGTLPDFNTTLKPGIYNFEMLDNLIKSGNDIAEDLKNKLFEDCDDDTGFDSIEEQKDNWDLICDRTSYERNATFSKLYYGKCDEQGQVRKEIDGTCFDNPANSPNSYAIYYDIKPTNAEKVEDDDGEDIWACLEGYEWDYDSLMCMKN
jgi:hypothetical protein